MDAPIKSITTAVVAEELRRMPCRLLIEISLYKKPSTRVYNTAIADASVAVKIPVTIPPITNTNKNKLGTASTKVLNTSLNELLLPILYFFFFAQTDATTISNKPVRIPGI